MQACGALSSALLQVVQGDRVSDDERDACFPTEAGISDREIVLRDRQLKGRRECCKQANPAARRRRAGFPARSRTAVVLRFERGHDY
jgi:hypothetical protein